MMISRWSLQRPPVRLASLATRLKQGRPPHIDCPGASTCLNPALVAKLHGLINGLVAALHTNTRNLQDAGSKYGIQVT